VGSIDQVSEIMYHTVEGSRPW